MKRIILATTLLAPVKYSVEELAELYCQRWQVELDNRVSAHQKATPCGSIHNMDDRNFIRRKNPYPELSEPQQFRYHKFNRATNHGSLRKFP